MKTRRPIEARLVPMNRGLAGRHLARCGRCGQALWVIEDGDGERRACLKDQDKGWRFDPETRVWHPTERHLAQRHAARDRIRAGTATDCDEAFVRFAGSLFGRRRKGGMGRRTPFKSEMTPCHGNEVLFGDTATLPVTVVCPQCAAPNELADPETPLSS